jgi:putative thioredoxin
LLERIQSLPQTFAEPAADDVAGQLAAADLAIAENEVDAALRRLLDLLVRTAGDDREQVRQRLIEYFDLLGPDDPRVPDARREMARALF